MTYALAVGYPLFLRQNKDGKMQAEIEIVDAHIALDSQQSKLWSYLNVLRQTLGDMEREVQILAAHDAAVTSETRIGVLDALCRHPIVRQGFCLPGEEGVYAFLGEEKWLLTGVQADIWREGDGQRPLEKLLDTVTPGWKSFDKQEKRLLLDNILGLAEADLIYFR